LMVIDFSATNESFTVSSYHVGAALARGWPRSLLAPIQLAIGSAAKVEDGQTLRNPPLSEHENAAFSSCGDLSA
jgi:hypothetical protein